jgi:hypothetical protein
VKKLPPLVEQLMLEIWAGEVDPDTGVPPLKNWARHRRLAIALNAKLTGKLNVPQNATPDELREIALFLEVDEASIDRHKLNILWSYLDAFDKTKRTRAIMPEVISEHDLPTVTEVRKAFISKFGEPVPTSFSISRTLNLMKLPTRKRGRGRPKQIMHTRKKSMCY